MLWTFWKGTRYASGDIQSGTKIWIVLKRVRVMIAMPNSI